MYWNSFAAGKAFFLAVALSLVFMAEVNISILTQLQLLGEEISAGCGVSASPLLEWCSLRYFDIPVCPLEWHTTEHFLLPYSSCHTHGLCRYVYWTASPNHMQPLPGSIINTPLAGKLGGAVH